MTGFSSQGSSTFDPSPCATADPFSSSPPSLDNFSAKTTGGLSAFVSSTEFFQLPRRPVCEGDGAHPPENCRCKASSFCTFSGLEAWIHVDEKVEESEEEGVREPTRGMQTLIPRT